MKYQLSYLISNETIKYIHDHEGGGDLDRYCRTVLCEELTRQIRADLVYSSMPATNTLRELQCEIEVLVIRSGFNIEEQQ